MMFVKIPAHSSFLVENLTYRNLIINVQIPLFKQFMHHFDSHTLNPKAQMNNL